MKGHISNSNGDVLIDNEVMAKYAGSAAVENFWHRRNGIGKCKRWIGKIAQER